MDLLLSCGEDGGVSWWQDGSLEAWFLIVCESPLLQHQNPRTVAELPQRSMNSQIDWVNDGNRTSSVAAWSNHWHTSIIYAWQWAFQFYWNWFRVWVFQIIFDIEIHASAWKSFSSRIESINGRLASPENKIWNGVIAILVPVANSNSRKVVHRILGTEWWRQQLRTSQAREDAVSNLNCCHQDQEVECILALLFLSTNLKIQRYSALDASMHSEQWCERPRGFPLRINFILAITIVTLAPCIMMHVFRFQYHTILTRKDTPAIPSQREKVQQCGTSCRCHHCSINFRPSMLPSHTQLPC